MPDFDAIATAVAARYAPAQVTPPSGMTNVRRATANLPQQVSPGSVLIFPDEGELAPGNGTRIGTHRLLARFYFALTKDLARETNACRRWLTVLVDQHLTSMQLGGTVVAVRTRGWKIGSLPYAGQLYTGIELRLEVITSEPWSPTA